MQKIIVAVQTPDGKIHERSLLKTHTTYEVIQGLGSIGALPDGDHDFRLKIGDTIAKPEDILGSFPEVEAETVTVFDYSGKAPEPETEEEKVKTTKRGRRKAEKE